MLGIVLWLNFDIYSYYSTNDFSNLYDEMKIPGAICALFCGILITVLNALHLSKKNKVIWFFAQVLIYTIITYSYFTKMCTDVYAYINMQSKDNHIEVTTSNAYAQMIPDEVGHDRYYIFYVDINTEAYKGFLSLRYEISQDRYLKIKREEDIIRVKLYEGRYGYYHSPEIYRE